MIIRYPAYFEDFSCIADACPDSCCKDWDVAVDEVSAAKYRDMSGPLGDALRAAMYEEDGDTYFRITDGRCPFWRADGLCRIQAERGHDALCHTCREFPRLTHDYGDFVEKGLCLSCPEAARLILSAKPAPWITRELPGGEAPECDSRDMQVLLQTRERMLRILSDESFSVPQVLALGLLYGYEAQAQLDGEEVDEFEPQKELAMAERLAQPSPLADLFAFYKGLELLTDTWPQRLSTPEGSDQWPEALRALARYGVERYWLQAVSDLDLAGRVKMVILSCILVRNLGGDLTATAQLYAKEIENDADNVEAILDGAYGDPALTDARILGWLLL